MIRKTTAILAAMTVATLAARAQQLSYTLTGGNISGSLNGVSFSDATWSLTATADSSTSTFHPAGGSLFAPVWSLDVTPTLTINSGSTELSATLTGWTVLSLDFSAFNPPNTAGAMVFENSYADNNTGGIESAHWASVIGTSADFNNLRSTGTFTGTAGGFDTATYGTSVGDLIISSDSQQPGVFSITPAVVPEPSALGLAALGGLGLLIRFRRNK